MIKVKAGVIPANLIIAAAAANVAETLGLTLVITSGMDGKHMVGSRHFIGQALDLRISNLTKPELATVLKALKTRLGVKYDVVLESDHIHVEFDK